MNFTKYEAFIKIVEHGSLTKAAEVLGYTQSGISHILNALESECDLKLLSRDRSGVTITSDGQELLPYFRRLCASYREFVGKIDELHGLESGLVRVGTFSSVSTHWLPSILQSFRETYPNIQFELVHGDYSEIENWISKGRVDCGFIKLPSTNGLETIFLKTDCVLAILPEGHPLAALNCIPMESLLQYPFITYEKETAGGIKEMINAYPIKANTQFVAEDDHAIIAMVENWLGVSVVPELVLQRTPYRIVARKLEPPVYRDLGLAFKSATSLSVAAKRFLSHTQKWMEAQRPMPASLSPDAIE